MADPATPIRPVELGPSFGPPPRRVRLRYGRRFDWAIRRVGLAAVLLACPSLMILPLWLSLILHRGELITGRVASHQVWSGRRGLEYTVFFTFPVSGREYTDHAEFSAALKRRYPPGAEITVKTWPAHPGLGALLWLDPAWQRRWASQETIGWVGGTLTGSAVTLIALWMGCHQAAQRAVIVRGLVTRGRILRKTRGSRRSGIAVYYQFVAPGIAWSGGSPLERAMLLREELTEQVQPGQEVTVLYLPGWPQTSVIYPLSFFEVYGGMGCALDHPGLDPAAGVAASAGTGAWPGWRGRRRRLK